MQLKFLLDENLSPWVALVLGTEDGIDACHIRDRGKLGIKDPEVLGLATREDRILVTANVHDFVGLARGREVHGGIVLLEDGSLGRDEQLTVVRASLALIEPEPDIINRVLWVALDGSMSFEDIPSE